MRKKREDKMVTTPGSDDSAKMTIGKTEYRGTKDKPKVYLIDIDGTICDDIPNEKPELFATAKAFPDALATLTEWRKAGHQVHFFTARREKHREVTEKWLLDNGFEYDSLVMNKPRIKDDEEYVWVDNKKVRAVTYLGKFTQLIEKTKTILVFDEPQS